MGSNTNKSTINRTDFDLYNSIYKTRDGGVAESHHRELSNCSLLTCGSMVTGVDKDGPYWTFKLLFISTTAIQKFNQHYPGLRDFLVDHAKLDTWRNYPLEESDSGS